MIEATGDLWAFEPGADARVITTNGFRKKNGEAVMGRGCAAEAAHRFPGLASYLGLMLADHGNHVHVLLQRAPCYVVSFPVKHKWFEKADLALIERSADELRTLVDGRGWRKVIVPRPGCGNGQLDWADVAPLLRRFFDDRFVAITNEP